MKAGIIGGIIGVIVIIAIVGFSIPVSDIENENIEWISSGPFSIDKDEYLLGENIFLITTALQSHEKGEIQFIRPSGDIYITIPFDGSLREDFNQYFTPFPRSALKVCSSDDLVGLWIVKFEGTDYKLITFEIRDEFLKGEEYRFENVCK